MEDALEDPGHRLVPLERGLGGADDLRHRLELLLGDAVAAEDRLVGVERGGPAEAVEVAEDVAGLAFEAEHAVGVLGVGAEDAFPVAGVGVEQAGLALGHGVVDLVERLLGNLPDVGHDQLRQVVRQPVFSPGLREVDEGAIVRHVQDVEPPGGGLEHLSADGPGLVAVGVELHLAEEEAADHVAEHHQEPQDPSREPDDPPDRPADHGEPGIGPAHLRQAVVPGVALVDDPGEPHVDGSDEERDPHPGPLGEVAELVGEHPGELLDVQARRQREADRQDEPPVEDRHGPALEPGRGVDPAIHVDPRGCQRTDGGAHAVHEREEERFLGRVERPRLVGPAGLREEGLGQERDHGEPGHDRHHVDEERPLAGIGPLDVVEDRVVGGRVPEHRVGDQPDQAQIDQGEHDHRRGHQGDHRAIGGRRLDRLDVLLERGEDLGAGQGRLGHGIGVGQDKRPRGLRADDPRRRRRRDPGPSGRPGELVGRVVLVGQGGEPGVGPGDRHRRLAPGALAPLAGGLVGDLEPGLARRANHADRHGGPSQSIRGPGGRGEPGIAASQAPD